MTEVMAAEIEKLIERLGKLTGPDREIDAMIQVLLFEKPDYKFPDQVANRTPINWQEACERFRWDGGWGSHPYPEYTKSIDAALTLVPDKHCFEVGDQPWRNITPSAFASVWNTGHEFARAATPAIALCIASLKAIAALRALATTPPAEGETK